MIIEKGLLVESASWSWMGNGDTFIIRFNITGTYEKPSGSWDYLMRLECDKSGWRIQEAKIKPIRPDSSSLRASTIARRISRKLPTVDQCMASVEQSFAKKRLATKAIQFQDDLRLTPARHSVSSAPEGEFLQGLVHFKCKRRRQAILVEVAQLAPESRRLQFVQVGVDRFLPDCQDFGLSMFLSGVEAVRGLLESTN